MKYVLAVLTMIATAATTTKGQLLSDLKNPAAETRHPGGIEMDQPCNYDRCAFRITPGFFAWRVVRGSEGVPVGSLGMFSAPDLEPDFSRVPDAAAEFHPFRKRYVRSGAVLWAGAALLFGGVAVGSVQSASWGPLAVGLAGLPVLWYGADLRAKSIDVLSRSIWLYNRSLPR